MLEAPPAILAEGVGKLYQTGLTEGIGRYRSLREELVRGITKVGSRGDGPTKGIYRALDDVSFTVGAGERVGIIGRNGAGKSTLLKLLSRITLPSEGRIELRGRVSSLLEVGTGFHPELTGRDNIFLCGAILGTRRSEIREHMDEIVEFSGIGDYIDTPVKRYSSGMYLRLGFSVAAHLETDILLVDEVLAVGDADFQKKCLGRMAEIGQAGRTVVFVSHSMAAVTRLCDRVILLDRGRVVADGDAAEVIRVYLDSGLRSRAEREWSEPGTAPGDGIARLKAVRVISDGQVADEVDIRRGIEVEVEYSRSPERPEVRVGASIHLDSSDGVCLFASHEFIEADWQEASEKPGTVISRCLIPGNFLAEGQFTVLAALISYQPQTVHALERDVVSFVVVDRSTGDGVRGNYGGTWPGAVRPMLRWTRSTSGGNGDEGSVAPQPALER